MSRTAFKSTRKRDAINFWGLIKLYVFIGSDFNDYLISITLNMLILIITFILHLNINQSFFSEWKQKQTQWDDEDEDGEDDDTIIISPWWLGMRKSNELAKRKKVKFPMDHLVDRLTHFCSSNGIYNNFRYHM